MLAAAWPLIREDFDLSYAQVGLALTAPALLGNLLEPAIGVLGDSPRRPTLVLGGGVAFSAAVVASALAPGYVVLVAALVVAYSASTAFVSLAQASLMDADPAAREHNMARWTLAGSVGVVAGPLLVSGAAALALGWRPLVLAVGLAALPLVWVARRLVFPHPRSAASIRSVLRALHRGEVWRWLILLEASDLLLDVFAGSSRSTWWCDGGRTGGRGARARSLDGSGLCG